MTFSDQLLRRNSDKRQYARRDSPVPLLQVYDSLVTLPPKTAADRHQSLRNKTLPTKQRAPRSPKNGQAPRRPVDPPGSNTRLPRFCFNDPRSEENWLVVYPPEAAVVRDVQKCKSSNLSLRSGRTKEAAGGKWSSSL